MKVVIAPNALKGTLSAEEAARAMAEGVRAARPDAGIVCMPLSDGGDGFLEVLLRSLDGERVETRVTDPLNRCLQAALGWVEHSRTAVIEMARASGLSLLREEEYDPLTACTAGTGMLIARALDLGASRILLGIGGSATCDGGTGLARTLGCRFLDDQGLDIPPGGGSLPGLAKIDTLLMDPRLAGCLVEVACDVRNPLLGETGAARVYAPQKGATPAQVVLLEQGLERLACCIQRELGVDVTRLVSGGAAGGLGAGLQAFLGAKLAPGAELVLDQVGFGEALIQTDLVLTAEGCLDQQTLQGKAPGVVARKARDQGIPCVALVGKVHLGFEELDQHGFTRVIELTDNSIAENQSRDRAYPLLKNVATTAVKALGLP